MVLFTGCASLTKSQIQETERFANTAHSFTGLAPVPAQTLGEAERFNQLLSASLRAYHTPDFGEADPDRRDRKASEGFEKFWPDIEKANAIRPRFDAVASELKASVNVFAVYSRALAEAARQDFSGDLDASAKAMGESINKSIESY